MEKLDQFLENALNITRSQINVLDIHRLPQRPLFKQGQVCRPIIIKLGSVFDNLKLPLTVNVECRIAIDSELSNGKYNKTFAQDFCKPEKFFLPLIKPKKRTNKPSGGLIMDSIFYLWITKQISPPIKSKSRSDFRASFISGNESVQFRLGK